MSLMKRGNTWWIDIRVNGKRHRESTNTSIRKVAERIQKERELELAKQIIAPVVVVKKLTLVGLEAMPLN